jgi:hypothetical protein
MFKSLKNTPLGEEPLAGLQENSLSNKVPSLSAPEAEEKQTDPMEDDDDHEENETEITTEAPKKEGMKKAKILVFLINFAFF